MRKQCKRGRVEESSATKEEMRKQWNKEDEMRKRCNSGIDGEMRKQCCNRGRDEDAVEQRTR